MMKHGTVTSARHRVQIREAELEDTAELARLRWEFRIEEQTSQARQEFLPACEDWFRKAMQSGRWIIAVASAQDGTLCGCMVLQCVEKVPVPGAVERAWGYITNSYVSPGQRGRGVGGELLHLLVDVAQSRKLEFLIVWPSAEAVSLYERAGFRLTTRSHIPPDDYPPLELTL